MNCKITVLNENKVIIVKSGTKLCEALRKTKILFGCSNGLCGVCCIEVEKGQDYLSIPSLQERETLHTLCLEAGQRLACQCLVYGDVSLRYINSYG